MSDNHIDSNIYLSRRLTFRGPKHHSKAIIDLKRALQKIKKDHHTIYYEWGNALSSQFKDKSALSKYKISAQINPSFPSTYIGWGFALLNLGYFDEAAEKFQKAHELAPDELYFRAHWGLSLYLTADESKAVKILEERDWSEIWKVKNLKVFYVAELQDYEWRKLKASNEEEVKLFEKIIVGTEWLIKVLSSKET